jgi:6-phosphogluconolactonase (cycloisomerase 2 family)
VWVANELASSLTAYAFDPALGQLRAERTTSLLPDDYTGESRAAGIATTGDTVYVSNRGHNSVTALHVNRITGAVVHRRWYATHGETPRFLTLTPDRSFLIVANEGSDTIARWRVCADGSLEDGLVVAKTGSPVCVTFMH